MVLVFLLCVCEFVFLMSFLSSRDRPSLCSFLYALCVHLLQVIGHSFEVRIPTGTLQVLLHPRNGPARKMLFGKHQFPVWVGLHLLFPMAQFS